MPHRHVFALLAAVAVFAGLAAVDTSAAATLAARLLPVLTFAASMSAAVNLAARVDLFAWLTAQLERATVSREVVFAGLLLLSIASTVFFSLDTTVIMVTPLAIQLAARYRLPEPAAALAVVWIANLASLPLPVSNLTNLLALGGGIFSSNHDYMHAAAAPAAAAILVAVVAAYLARWRHRHTAPTHAGNAPQIQRPTGATAVLGCTVVALLTPVPYWLTGVVTAVAMWFAVGPAGRGGGASSLIPWPALSLAATLAAAATLALQLGGTAALTGTLAGTHPGVVAAAGAVTANAVNNIPAYLLLEPAAVDAASAMALLVGVNAGSVVTPWASLATLLWADQLRRAGADVPWGRFVAWGAVLAPVAVAVATVTLLASL
ncbi:SLC13 family permease [Corynebacterium ureicelerivorans]|uniref:SLC13 family permease n=1 Tax=Corynebacterium ureicelerivorans TaxID=401472 RepID=UPI0026517517|nr:SLC13 family permease [Corynebacterium ureicelerivorans]MDN8604767.1 SLC13 family permease [Corynebacterium ureicelerivorans]